MGGAYGHAGVAGHLVSCGQFSRNHVIIRSNRSMVKFAVPGAAAMRGSTFGSSAAAKDTVDNLRSTALA